jgi:hypothetical protein
MEPVRGDENTEGEAPNVIPNRETIHLPTKDGDPR